VRRLLPLSLLAVVALVGAACGGVPGGEVTSASPETVVGTVKTEPKPTVPPEYANGDAAAGKAIFASKGCATCHTLADAGATGTIGPNLDEVKPDLAIAVDRIVNGKGTMPPFKSQLSTKEIADVAAYVVQASGGGG
jgi:mono/diheme cytochrome c family protein